MTKHCGLCERDLPKEAFALDLRKQGGRKATRQDCRRRLGIVR